MEQIVLDIEYAPRFPIFVGQQEDSIYLQVGIVGYDNYQASEPELKIVYGRKWRVEPQLPSSEIIQTAFLAIQKAREHEIRELLSISHHGHKTTPFNNHHDLPLMAQQSATLSSLNKRDLLHDGPSHVATWLNNVKYDGAQFSIIELAQRSNGSWLLDFEVHPEKNTSLEELYPRQGCLLLDNLHANTLYFALMDTLLSWSNSHVEENFRFQGFARFSRKNCVTAISELSVITRQREAKKIQDDFTQQFTVNNYETDQTRIPQLAEGPLKTKITQQLRALKVKHGLKLNN